MLYSMNLSKFTQLLHQRQGDNSTALNSRPINKQYIRSHGKSLNFQQKIFQKPDINEFPQHLKT